MFRTIIRKCSNQIPKFDCPNCKKPDYTNLYKSVDTIASWSCLMFFGWLLFYPHKRSSECEKCVARNKQTTSL